MKRFFTSVLICTSSLFLTNCKPDDNTTTFVERDRQEVYNENIVEIENFLKNNALKVNGAEISFVEAKDGETPIWDQTHYPLQSSNFTNDTYSVNQNTGKYEKNKDNVTYKIYYLVINEGGGETPSPHDNVFTSYKGFTLSKEKFEQNDFGFWSSFPAYSNYGETLSGYRQILQKIKTATGVIDNEDGTYTFENPGRVIVFIPSGLGYFSSAQSLFGEYSPLIFDITLISMLEADHDNDGILDKYEDVNNNGNLWDDDTDGDGKANFLDIDDDGDGYTTRQEITYTTTENGQTIDKLYTFDEIPTCNNGSIKKHLDKSCH